MRIFLLFTLLTLFSCQPETGPPAQKRGKTEPIDFFYQQRTYPDGRVNQKALQAAAQAYVQEMALKSSTQNWEAIGPYNIGGRITDLAVRQRTNGTESIFIGAASGGVFRSNDGGANWTPVFDEQPSLAIGSITLSPHNEETVYVGTGEINAGGGSIAYEGTGLYKSTDNGDTWTNIGLPNSASIGEIAIHPTNPSILFAACMGTLFEESQTRGIYRSLDGGDTWEQVLYQGPNTGGVTVIIDPIDPQRIYATLWERYRRPNNRQYFGESSGLFISTDGGDTWARNEFTSTTNLSKISITMAPSNPAVMYLSAVSQDLRLEGVYKSTDRGENWTPLSTEGELDIVSFEYWFNEIFVDPLDEHTLHRLGFTASKTTTAGNTNSWEYVFPGVHVDQHAYWIDPTNTSRILLGNDGGLFESTDAGTTYDQFLNLPITQSYASAVAPNDATRRFSGNQDNGTWGSSPGNENSYSFLTGGDGFRIAVEPGNNPVFYTEFQFGNMYRHQNGTVTYINNLPVGQYNWNTPIVIDPATPTTIYSGAQNVIRSTNRGVSWQTISPSLIGNDAEFGNLPFNTIYALAVSPVDNNVIWAGLDNGKVWVTTNGGSNWTDVSAGFPNRWVTSIAPHPTEAQTAYLTFSGFRWNEAASHVFRYTAGTTDQPFDIGTDLPDVPVNEIIVDSMTMDLYLATDVGVYRSQNEGMSWEVFGMGLPAIVVSDLTLHEDSRMLFAGTYGRSLYATQLVNEPPSSVRDLAGLAAVSVYPNPTKGDFKVAMSLSKPAVLDLRLYSLDGRLVANLGEQTFGAGEQAWAVRLAGKVPTGTYVLNLGGWSTRLVVM